MRVLITNDDGYEAEGIQALRRALREIDGVEPILVAPAVNQSAMGRSITTREPMWVEEVRFADGDTGFAAEGTPVDCVRFAEHGLIGQRPDLIVSGINHGSNLGDDVTYSGTVAAALEGIVLGIPAMAFSQQAARGEMGWQMRPALDFDVAAGLARELVIRHLSDPLPASTLLNVNCPAGEVGGIDVTRLGKRRYNDELQEVDTDGDSRRRFRLYGFEPSYDDEPGTDLAAVARNRASMTPLHFDLTDSESLEVVRGWDADGFLERAVAGIAETP